MLAHSGVRSPPSHDGFHGIDSQLWTGVPVHDYVASQRAADRIGTQLNPNGRACAKLGRQTRSTDRQPGRNKLIAHLLGQPLQELADPFFPIIVRHNANLPENSPHGRRCDLLEALRAGQGGFELQLGRPDGAR
jgi:hypothetical protein